MSAAEHTGKLVLDVPHTGHSSVVVPPEQAPVFRDDGAYRIRDLDSVVRSHDLIEDWLVRTGMGAMAASKSWHLYRPGYGPSVDGLFQQSNLGIVVKSGVWLMPTPETYMCVDISVPRLK